ncbi:MAG: transporter [Actinomycetia bacterium]|nr:transporter [Actinomycetes bacterium]
MGGDFRRLWTASAISSLGDGAMLAAGPLFVASQTSDPLLVAAAMFAQQLPWLLFSLIAGAYVDRLERRRLIVVVNLLRAFAVGGLALGVGLDAAGLPVIYAALFLLGTGDSVARNAETALLPSLVGEDDLAAANARLFGATTLGAQLAGPPLGAYLFAVAAALPFGIDAASFVAAAALVAGIGGARSAPTDREARSLRHEVAEALRWLWEHRALRLLALCICAMNITFSGAMAVYVVYAKERLGLGPIGYGALLTVSAVGGVLGTGFVARLESRFGASLLLRVGLLLEAATHVGLALTRNPWVAGGIMAVFGVHALVWSVVTLSLRQRAVPSEMLGRVNGVYYLFSVGGSAVGALVGGVVAHVFGITAPFWIGAALVALLAVVTWRRFAAEIES